MGSNNYKSYLNLPGIYSAIEFKLIKIAQVELRDHVHYLQRGLQEKHQEILEVTKNIKKLYEYFYTQFLSLADKTNSIQCNLQNSVKTLAN